jgi:hypothetical protein
MVAASLTRQRPNTSPAHPRTGGSLPASANLANLGERTTLVYLNNGKMRLALCSDRHKAAAASACRRLVARPHNPMLQTVIDADLLSLFVRFLAENRNPALQVEAAWVLTNVAAGTRLQTLAVASTGAVPSLVRLLHTEASHLLLSLVAWALANIARELRDEVLHHGALPRLLNVLEYHTHTFREMRDTASPRSEMIHLLCQLCHGTPRPPLDLLRPALPVLVRIASSSHNQEVLVSVSWALESFVASDRHSLQAAIDAGALQVLAGLATHEAQAVAVNALNALLQVAIVNDAHAHDLVDAGALAPLRECLTRDDAVCMIACDVIVYLIRNGCLGPVLRNGIFPVVFDLMHTTSTDTVAAHAAYVVLHACLAADVGAHSLCPSRFA